MSERPSRGAFIVIKTAEGTRTKDHKVISREEYERQRDALERGGIKRVHNAVVPIKPVGT